MDFLTFKFIFVATCPEVNLENGQVEYNLSSQNGQYLTGTLASFTCDDGHVINGSLSSTCQDTGTWNPQLPTCEGTVKIYYY